LLSIITNYSPDPIQYQKVMKKLFL